MLVRLTLFVCRRSDYVLNIDKQSSRPVYEQILEQFKRLILVGSLKPDEQIPSVRALSLDLSVNPNTIQKAYNALELTGITYSVPGVGRFVSKDAREKIGGSFQNKLDCIYDAALWLALAGVDPSLITDTVQKAYSDAKRQNTGDDAR
jgi:Predicted transcriptional regulators